ncbi:MAG: hypothetical protein ACT4N8_05760 [Sphingosinicella sp.]|uniref:hypothetical protein n=1 Tax=Sphingosinicella sp. TaxID=1917971 RepID=UPI0040376CCF
MRIRQKWLAWGRVPVVKQGLFLLGVLMIIVSPLVGAIPGPGGIIVFAFGFGLVLKYSEWAKRLYVRFKRRHPNKGRWADWSLRRLSARRREENRQRDGADASVSD